jgi:hypothetical protein
MPKKAEKYIDENGMRWWGSGEIARERGVAKGTADMWCAKEGCQSGGSNRVSDEWLSAKLATRREDGSFPKATQDSIAKMAEVRRAKPYYDENGVRWWSSGEISREHCVIDGTASNWCKNEGVEIGGTKRLPDSWVLTKLAIRMPDGSFPNPAHQPAKLTEQQVFTITRLLLMGATTEEIMDAAGVTKDVARKTPTRTDIQAAVAAITQDAERYGWRFDQEDKRTYGVTPKWLRASGKAKPTSLTAKRNLNGITLISSSGIHREMRQKVAA